MWAISKYKPPGAYIWRGDLTEGFLRHDFGGLIFGRVYTWRGLFSEFYGMFTLYPISFRGAHMQTFLFLSTPPSTPRPAILPHFFNCFHEQQRHGTGTSRLTNNEPRVGAVGRAGFGELNASPRSWIFTSSQWIAVPAPTCSLPQRSEYLFTLHQSMAQKPVWRSTLRLDVGQLCSVTEIAPKLTFLRVNRSFIRYGFRAGAKVIRYRMT